jgi:hypothetical protein
MFKGGSADTYAGKFLLVSMGGQADTSNMRRGGARTPIGASRHFCQIYENVAQQEPARKLCPGFFPYTIRNLESDMALKN